MSDTKPRTKETYEAALQRLLGRSIRRVSYVELDYGNDESEWNKRSVFFDSLDHGFEWWLDDGSVCSCIWGWEFAAHEVSIAFSSIDATGRRWDVTERWHERGLLENRITKIQVDWWQASARLYPQSVCIRFSSGASIVVSAYEEGRVQADHITVFFDEAEAARLVRR